MNTTNLIRENVETALHELLQAADMKAGNILVVGCSTSEIGGKKIGSESSLELASAVLKGISSILKQAGLYLAVQCCEHLNRALVVEREYAEQYGLLEVLAIPQQHAGGSFATIARQEMNDPMLIETIQAHAGMDIGDTFIGMHLRRVAVPVRSSIKEIGQAHLTMARTRPPFIGGERARYQ